MKLRSYKKRKNFVYLTRGLMTIILSVFLALFFINVFSKRASEVIIPMAEAKLRKIVATLINESTNDIKFDKELFTLMKDNSYEVTKLINEVTGNIESRLGKIHDGSEEEARLLEYTIQEVPFGVLFGHTLLRGVGPKIKIKSEMVGSIISNIETEVKPYGINNAYVETRIYLVVRARKYLPFVSKDVEIRKEKQKSLNILQGSVPQGYIASYKN